MKSNAVVGIGCKGGTSLNNGHRGNEWVEADHFSLKETLNYR